MEPPVIWVLVSASDSGRATVKTHVSAMADALFVVLIRRKFESRRFDLDVPSSGFGRVSSNPDVCRIIVTSLALQS